MLHEVKLFFSSSRMAKKAKKLIQKKEENFEADF
jgi:hypothetical protein